MAAPDRRNGPVLMAPQSTHALEYAGALAVVLAAWVTGRWQRGLKILDLKAKQSEESSTERSELVRSLLARIQQLDDRVEQLEADRDRKDEEIKALSVQAAVNKQRIERLMEENKLLRKQLACPLPTCPFVHDGKFEPPKGE